MQVMEVYRGRSCFQLGEPFGTVEVPNFWFYDTSIHSTGSAFYAQDDISRRVGTYNNLQRLLLQGKLTSFRSIIQLA